MYEFNLYVAGRTTKSTRIIEELKTFLTSAFDGHYSLEVIDVTQNPQLAQTNKVMATPTLEKITPEPARKVVGDVSNSETVLLALGLTAE